jgi:hypothetical protein
MTNHPIPILFSQYLESSKNRFLKDFQSLLGTTATGPSPKRFHVFGFFYYINRVKSQGIIA